MSHKIAKKSTRVDMTAMCDVAFLLLTFFMLATQFKAPDAAPINMPSSISQIKIPDRDIMMITIEPTGTIHMSIDGQNERYALINQIDEKRQLGLTEEEKRKFVLAKSVGVPFNRLKSYLGLTLKDIVDKEVIGIPIDSTNNQLAEWISASRQVNPALRVAIKADETTKYPAVAKVIKTLQEQKINKINLVTNLETKSSK